MMLLCLFIIAVIIGAFWWLASHAPEGDETEGIGYQEVKRER